MRDKRRQQEIGRDPSIFSALDTAITQAEANLGTRRARTPPSAAQLSSFMTWFRALADADGALRALRGLRVDDREALCRRISEWIITGARDGAFLQKHPDLIAYCGPLLSHFATQAQRAATAGRAVRAATNPFGLPSGEP